MFDRKLFPPASYRDRKYREFIGEWPCLCCPIGRQGSATEAAHTGEHGLGVKAPDIWTVPLCGEHHRGPAGLDRLGPEEFEKRYNIDLKKEALWLINAYLTIGNQLGN